MAVRMLERLDEVLLDATQNSALEDTQIPLLDATLSDAIGLASTFATTLYELFVIPTPFDDREVKSLSLRGNENITSIVTPGTFELYMIKEELATNPILQNADRLREEALAQKGVCSITFEAYSEELADPDPRSSYVEAIVESIKGCDVRACSTEATSGCKPVTDQDDVVVEFVDCDCDLVAHLVGEEGGEEVMLSMTTVSRDQKGLINDVVLLGLFEAPVSSVVQAERFHGLPINDPVVHDPAPVFSTVEELTGLMGDALMGNASAISQANVTARYEESGGDVPGIFIFIVDITVGMNLTVNFGDGVELGNLARVEVGDGSSLSLGGSFRVRNEFGMIPAEEGFTPSFANGQFLVEAEIGVEGSVDIEAFVGPASIEARLDTELRGGLRLAANREGNYLGLSEFLAGLGGITKADSDFPAHAVAVFDGFFDALVVIARSLPVRARGEFVEPFVFDLLNGEGREPEIAFRIEVPDSALFSVSVTDFLAINFGFNFGDEEDKSLFVGATFEFDTNDG